MRHLFEKKKESQKKARKSHWKEDFSDCVAMKFLPDYSVCKCENRRQCKFAAMFSGMIICCNPGHEDFIPEGSESFDPYSVQFF